MENLAILNISQRVIAGASFPVEETPEDRVSWQKLQQPEGSLFQLLLGTILSIRPMTRCFVPRVSRARTMKRFSNSF